MRGNYSAAQHIFEMTDNQEAPPEMQALAETLGLMGVKIEAREMALEQKLEQIERQNQALREAARVRAESGFMLCYTAVYLFLYAFALKVLLSLGWIRADSTIAFTLGLMLALLGGILFYIRKFHRPLSTWGLTWKGGLRAICVSLPVTLLLILVLIGCKVWLVRQPWSSLFGQPVFRWNWSFIPLIPYAFSVFVQEIIARGFLQTSSERVLDGKYRGLISIVMASALFSVAHFHYSLPLMAGAFLTGLLLGWMFYYQRTLVGVVPAHFLLSLAAWEWLGLIG